MGLFDWLSENVGNVYNTIKDTVGSITKTVKQWSEGQYHAPGGYNYCGPGTNLHTAGKPINKADEACMAHDYEYDALAKNKNNISQTDFNRLIRESDTKLINSIDQSGQSDIASPIEYIGSLLSKYAIKGKNYLEDLGILNRDRFVG